MTAPAFVAATRAGGTTSNSTPFCAGVAGIGASDVQFAFLDQSFNRGAPTVPGWTQVGTYQTTVANYQQQVTLYWRVGPGDFAANSQAPYTSYWSVGIVAYSGCSTSAPYQDVQWAQSSTAPAASVTAATTAIRFYAATSGSTSTTPSITPNTTARLTGSGPAPLLVVASSDDPVSPTTAAARTWRGNSSANYPVAVTIVLAQGGSLGHVVVGGAEKPVAAASVIVGGVKKPLA